MRPESILIPVIRQVLKRPKLADVLFSRDKWGNQLGPERYAWPYPGYELMRAEGPVAWHRLYNSWFVTGYEEARTVLNSPHGRTAAQLEMLLDVSPYTKLNQTATDIFKLFLLLVDPPEHTRLRSLVSRTFTPKQMARLEPAINRLVDELLDAVDGEDEVDLAAALAKPLPVQVICELIGVPRERWPWLQGVSTEVVKLLNPFVGFDPDTMNETFGEIDRYFRALADERRAEPTDDLLTALATVEVDGERLTDTEVVAMTVFILFAGHETTTGLIGTSLLALARHPDQRDRLATEPELWGTALDELVRFDPPVQTDTRRLTVDTEIGGVTVKADQSVAIMLGACNRDPRVFTDPDVLRLDRSESPPLSFGHGLHYCIGANLARLELRIAVQAVLDRFGAFTIDEDQVSWSDGLVARQATSLPVKRGVAAAAS